jgi:hypothetical protein
MHWLLGLWIIHALITGSVDYPCTDYWACGLSMHDYWVCGLSMHWLLGLWIIHALITGSVDYPCTDNLVCGWSMCWLIHLWIIYEYLFVILTTCWSSRTSVNFMLFKRNPSLIGPYLQGTTWSGCYLQLLVFKQVSLEQRSYYDLISHYESLPVLFSVFWEQRSNSPLTYHHSPQPFATMVRLSSVLHHLTVDLKIMSNFELSTYLIIPSSIDLDNGEYTIFLLSH